MKNDNTILVRLPTELKQRVQGVSKGNTSAWIRSLISAELKKK